MLPGTTVVKVLGLPYSGRRCLPSLLLEGDEGLMIFRSGCHPEADILIDIQHRYPEASGRIPRVLEHEEDYMVTDHILGQDIGSFWNASVPPTIIDRWLTEALVIMDIIHKAGYAHNDLKYWEHILVTGAGSIAIIGFDKATRYTPQQGKQDITDLLNNFVYLVTGIDREHADEVPDEEEFLIEFENKGMMDKAKAQPAYKAIVDRLLDLRARY